VDPAGSYALRRDAFAAEERRLARISLRFSLVRAALLVLFLGCLLTVVVLAGSPPLAAWIGAAAAVVAFLAVLPRHEQIVRRQRRANDLRRINEEGLLRMARDWTALPVPAAPEAIGGPLSRDLGLFGPGSLFHLLGTVHSPPGKTTLARWLLEPAEPEEISQRQEAVAGMASDLDFRQQLEARTLAMEKLPPDSEPFLRWAEDRPWLLEHPGLIWLTRLLALLASAAFVLLFTPGMPSWPFLLLATINVGLSYRLQERIAGSFDRIEAHEGAFQLYADALEVVERPGASARLRRLASDLTPQGLPAHRWREILHRRIELSDARHSGILHFFLQTVLLWDFHTLLLLERWQREAGPHVRRWLAALGEVEALGALAMLRHDNPAWAFPLIDPARDRFAGTGLGHPLVAEDRRVGNDVEVGPPGSFLLVTGSNMSGKSTLLRAIGVNAVLAQAGGPVCAAALSLPPVALATSILVEDSLTDGVSFFMAELKRIRSVVDEAQVQRRAGRRLLYLLDEILRGTNSVERQIAVRRVLHHLLESGAIGAISTHDLQVAEIPELATAARPVHFRETLNPGGDPPMTFDYRMQPGVATTTNALLLMELVGLPPESPESPE
jgi:hypothetical protein